VIRLAGALLIEQNDEWLISRRYLTIESMAILDAAQDQDSHTDNNQGEEVIALSAA
jgi:putative transposase